METKTYEEVLDETGVLCWRTVGVSMRPLIREGLDVVAIRKLQAPPRKYDVVLFRRPGVEGRGRYALHRVLRVNGDGTYWIVGDNCSSGETVEEGNILGVLAEMTRGGRKIEMDGRLSRLYAHLWCDCYPARFLIVRYKGYPRSVARKLIAMAKRPFLEKGAGKRKT